MVDVASATVQLLLLPAGSRMRLIPLLVLLGHLLALVGISLLSFAALTEQRRQVELHGAQAWTLHVLCPRYSIRLLSRSQAGAVGNATLQNFPEVHFSRWGSAQPPARRNSLVANSEISVASDGDDEVPPAGVPFAVAAVMQSSTTGGGERRQASNDAIIDIALHESAA